MLKVNVNEKEEEVVAVKKGQVRYDNMGTYVLIVKSDSDTEEYDILLLKSDPPITNDEFEFIDGSLTPAEVKKDYPFVASATLEIN